VKKPLPKILTVLIDTREQNPLVFPSTLTWYNGNTRHLFTVRTASSKLPTGDYALAGFEDSSLCERKGSMGELRTNLLTKDRARWEGCIYRLTKECVFPWILLDIPQSERRRVTEYVPEPDKVLDALLLNVTTWGVPVYWVEPGKTPLTARHTGEFVVRKLWAGVYAHHYNNHPKGDARGLVGGKVDTGSVVNTGSCDPEVVSV
jgi:hypothetical protein